MANYVCYLLKNSHFVASRFTKARKEEMLNAFQAGKSFGILAKEFSCTPATVTRILKGLLPEDEFLQLKNARKKSSKNNSESNFQNSENSQNISDEFKEEVIFLSSSLEDEFSEENAFEDSSDEGFLESVDKVKAHDGQFHELVPLVTNFEWDKQKEVACQPFSPDLLPVVVFMLVDKTVEIDSRPLKDFSQWSFLPDKDQNRLAIVLYSNQRSAKRSCSRSQRVLKVPDSSIFKMALPHLISKGITRLILDDSLISIDS